MKIIILICLLCLMGCVTKQQTVKPPIEEVPDFNKQFSIIYNPNIYVESETLFIQSPVIIIDENTKIIRRKIDD